MSSNYITNSFIYQTTKAPLSTKRSSSKQQIFILSNNHTHMLSQNTPLCKICGSIFKIPENDTSSSSITSLKPTNLNYPPEISQYEIMEQFHKESKQQTIPQLNINNEKEINMFRKTMITKMRNFQLEFEMNDFSFYLGVFLMDTLILKEKPTTFHKIEQIGTATYLIAMKYTELNICIPSIKQYQHTFCNESGFSYEHLKCMEVNIMKQLNYKLNFISFFNVVQFFLMNGIVFTNDKNTDQSYERVYSLVRTICKYIIEHGLQYFIYNQVYIACAIIAFSRKLSEQEKWPSIFVELYHINESDFQSEFEFVNESYLKKVQITKMNKKTKITRNSNRNLNNNLYKVKNKGFFHSNNTNKRRNQPLKKIFTNKKIVSRSMEMTSDISTARNSSSNQKSNNKSKRHSHTSFRKIVSKEDLKGNKRCDQERRCLSNNRNDHFRINHINNNKNKIRVCSAKKDINEYYLSRAEKISHNIRKLEYNSNSNTGNTYKIKSTYSRSHSRAVKTNQYNSNSNSNSNSYRNYYSHITGGVRNNNTIIHVRNHSTNHNNIKIKEHLSMNSSYCTVTETMNINNHNSNNIDKVYIKKTNSNNIHKDIQDYRSKVINSSKQSQNHKPNANEIQYLSNVSQSFHNKINNESNNNNNNNNDIIICKVNNEKQHSNIQDMIKRKINIMEEIAINKLSRVSNKAKHIIKKQASFSKQKHVQINNGKHKYINEKQIRKIRELMSAKKKLIKNNPV